MINTYDILVNFKKNAYEFYEWEKEDEVRHIKKIPTFKVSNAVLLDFLNNNVIIEKEFLQKIKKQTEVFKGRIISVIEYACVLFCDNEAISFMFDNTGNIIGRSKMLFDEADEIILKGREQKEEKIDYNIKSVIKKNNFFTRKELKLINMLENYLDNLYDKRKFDEIKYMHFECFDISEEDEKKAYSNLKDSITKGDFKIINKVRSLLKVLKK